MKNAVILGAGRSSIYLIQYLLAWAEEANAKVNKTRNETKDMANAVDALK
ncbi:MAG: hypothetical protein ACPF8V_08985 [Luteibaculum sp.]